MRRSVVVMIAAWLIAVVAVNQSSAGVPLQLNHQGRLLDGSDNPINGPTDITFRIFADSIGGTALWEEVHSSVPVEDGLFQVLLGASTPITADIVVAPGAFNPQEWLEIQVNGQVLSPRTQLVSSPFSLATSRVSGDIETSPGQLLLEDLGGTTTATIRVSNDPGNDGSEVLLDNLGGTTTATIRASSSTGGIVIVTDGYGDMGVSTTALQSLGGDIHVHSHMSGSTTGTIRMQSGLDSVFSSTGIDTDNNGSTDNGTLISATESRNVLKSFFETGDKPAEAQFKTGNGFSNVEVKSSDATSGNLVRASADSTGSSFEMSYDNFTTQFEDNRYILRAGVPGISTEMIHDLNGDGLPDILVGRAASDSGFYDYLDMDSDNDGIAEATYKLQSGFIYATQPPRQELSRDLNQDGIPDIVVGSAVYNDSALHYQDMDSDGDGITDRRLVMVSGTFGSGSKVEVDANSDGATDLECTSRVDSDSATFRSSSRFAAGPRQSIDLSSTFTKARLSVISDINNDGLSDVGCSMQSTEDSIVIDRFFKNGVVPTENDFSDVIDSYAVRSTLSSTNGSTTGTIRMMTTTDSVSEVSSISDSASSSTSSTRTRIDELESKLQAVGLLSSVSSTTTITQTSGTHATDMDLDRDGIADVSITTGVIDQFGNPVGSMYIDTDSDDDGVADNSVHATTDADSAVVEIGDIDGDGYLRLKGGTSVSGSVTISSGGSLRTTVSTENVVLTNTLMGLIDTGVVITNDGRVGIGVASPTDPIEHSSGAHLTAGGVWTNASDENLKENIREVDGTQLLEKLAGLDISQWNYKVENDNVTHIGPTAQDFKNTFGVGSDDKTISTIDPSGIALAAIKELYEQLKEKDNELKELRIEIERLKSQIE